LIKEQAVSEKSETALVVAARTGDEDAFRELTEPLRRELHVHCYRMLGSLDDADDALQETLLRAWRGLDQYEPRAPFRAWLYRIATNVCLTMLARRTSRGEITSLDRTADRDFPSRQEGESVHLQPYPDRLLDEFTPAEIVEFTATLTIAMGFSKAAIAWGPPDAIPVTDVPSPGPGRSVSG